MKMAKKYPVILFFILTLILSWVLWLPLLFIYDTLTQLIGVFIIIGGFSPFIAAMIITRLSEGKTGLKDWLKSIFHFRSKISTYLFALIYPLFYAFTAYGLYLLFGGIPAAFSQIPPVYLYPFGILFVFFLGGGQEEPGWRGFALKRLLKSYNPFLSSIFIGIVWAIWHLPLFFIEGSSQAGIPFGWYFPNVIGMSILFTMLYLRSNRSVIPSMLLHAGLNTAIGWFPMQKISLPPYAFITIAGWIIVVFLIALFYRKSFFTKPGQ